MKGPIGQWISRHLNLSRFLAVVVVIGIAPIAEFIWGKVLGDYVEDGEPEAFKVFVLAPLTNGDSPIFYRDLETGFDNARNEFFGDGQRWRESIRVEVVVKNTRGKVDRLRSWLAHVQERSDVLAVVLAEKNEMLGEVATEISALSIPRLYVREGPQQLAAGLDYVLMPDRIGEAGSLSALLRQAYSDGRRGTAVVSQDSDSEMEALDLDRLQALQAACRETCPELHGPFALAEQDATIKALDKIDPHAIVYAGPMETIGDFAERAAREIKPFDLVIPPELLITRQRRDLATLRRLVIGLPSSSADDRGVIGSDGAPDFSAFAYDGLAIIARALDEYDDMAPDTAPPLTASVIANLLKMHSYRGRAGQYQFDADGYNQNARILWLRRDRPDRAWQIAAS